MPEPEGYGRKVFASGNSFNPNTRWNTTGKTITAVSDDGESEGFCFAMTCYWIKLALQHGIEGSSRVLDGRALLHISIVQSGYLRLRRTFTGAPGRSKDLLVYQQSGLKLVWQKKVDEAMQNLQGMQGQKLACFEIGLPEHSVGMILDRPSNKLFYFDPNYGLFEYGPEGLRDVMIHWYYEYGLNEKELEFACVTLG